MTTVPPLHDIPAEVFRPLRVEEFQAMVELGLFEDTHVELLGGVLVETSPQGAPHNTVIRRLNRLLLTGLDDAAAGYPEYSVVDAARLEIVVHTGPSPDGWQHITTVTEGVLTPAAVPSVEVDLAVLFAGAD